MATLAGTPSAVLDDVYARVRLTPGIRELVADVQRRGGLVAIVSGGFHEVLDPIARDLGIDRWRANRLDARDGVLTGHVIGPVVDARAKADALRNWAAEAGIPLSRTVAIGDGANDLEMMAAAALSIGFNPKPIVRREAAAVIEDDLTRAIALFERLAQ